MSAFVLSWKKAAKYFGMASIDNSAEGCNESGLVLLSSQFAHCARGQDKDCGFSFRMLSCQRQLPYAVIETIVTIGGETFSPTWFSLQGPKGYARGKYPYMTFFILCPSSS